MRFLTYPLDLPYLVANLSVGRAMLQQWEADALLTMDKIYSRSDTVALHAGVDQDYPIESTDGTEFFLLDVYVARRDQRKARFQLRYQRDVVLSRLCTRVPHTNPNGDILGAPHLHRYREGDADKWATELEVFQNVEDALQHFCELIKLPMPNIQGGVL